MSLMRFQLFDFLHKETGEINGKLLSMTVASGVSNVLNLAIVNAAMESVQKGGPFWQHFVFFGLSLSLFVYSLRFVLHQSSRIAEKAVAAVRIRLADKIRNCDLLALEQIGENDIHARIARDTGLITQVARPLFAAAQAGVMVVFTMVYITTISPLALLLCLGLILAGALYYLKDRAEYESQLQVSSGQEDRMTGLLTGLLKGFKEIRINRRKSDDVMGEFSRTVVQVQDVRTKVMQMFADMVVFIEMFFVILLGAIVFVMPVLSDNFSPGAVTKIVAAILFFFGPLATVIMMIPVFTQVNVTVDNLRRLESDLDGALAASVTDHDAPMDSLDDFKIIEFRGVRFSYRDPDGGTTFQVGPIDARIERGEIFFLVGGNGSGKTTFMKLLTALYPPTEGAIYVDGKKIGPHNIQSYRNLFSAIFSDFHLYQSLHGLHDAAPAEVEDLLRQMGLDGKTRLENGAFTNVQLSTGQRKRLALVVACLEKKPIYMFDEVAADQDPHFRDYFYNVLLKKLADEGRTVVVVSHDDRYFKVGKRVLQMDYGQLKPYVTRPPARPRAHKPEATA